MNSSNDSDNDDDDSRNTDSIRSGMWHRDRDSRSESTATVSDHGNDNEPTGIGSITSTDTDGIQTNETSDTVSQSPSPPRRPPPTFVPRLRLETVRNTGTQNTERLPPESAFRAFSRFPSSQSSNHQNTNTPTCTYPPRLISRSRKFSARTHT